MSYKLMDRHWVEDALEKIRFEMERAYGLGALNAQREQFMQRRIIPQLTTLTNALNLSNRAPRNVPVEILYTWLLEEVARLRALEQVHEQEAASRKRGRDGVGEAGPSTQKRQRRPMTNQEKAVASQKREAAKVAKMNRDTRRMMEALVEQERANARARAEGNRRRMDEERAQEEEIIREAARRAKENRRRMEAERARVEAIKREAARRAEENRRRVEADRAREETIKREAARRAEENRRRMEEEMARAEAEQKQEKYNNDWLKIFDLVQAQARQSGIRRIHRYTNAILNRFRIPEDPSVPLTRPVLRHLSLLYHPDKYVPGRKLYPPGMTKENYDDIGKVIFERLTTLPNT
jgi:hypothetical protein